MIAARFGLRVAGIAALLVGLLWIGQGTGVVRWPASSFMIDQSAWTVRGAALALGGAVALWLASRRPR